MSSDAGPPVGLVARYNAAMAKRPLLVTAVTSAFIVGGGDVLAQLAIEKNGYDPVRTARMGFLGAALIAPTLHVWCVVRSGSSPPARLTPARARRYGTLARVFPAATTAGAIQRLVVDQLLFAPTFICVFMGSVFALEGRSFDELRTTLRNDWAGMVVDNWKLWVPAQFITFRFVPLQYQVLWANSVALIWNTYLSYMAHRGDHSDGGADAPKG